MTQPVRIIRPRWAALALLAAAALTAFYPALEVGVVPGAGNHSFLMYRLVPAIATLSAVLLATRMRATWIIFLGRSAASVFILVAALEMWELRYSFAGARGILATIAAVSALSAMVALMLLPGTLFDITIEGS